MTDPTVSALAEFSRRKPREWRLVCPECWGDTIKLVDGVYQCTGRAGHPFECGFTDTLDDLLRGEEIRR